MLRVNVDMRALQDENYADRGIGQHTLYVASVLRGIDRVHIVGLADPLLPPIQKTSLFDGDASWLDRMEGDVFLSPSPLTHDTAPFVTATRLGMRRGAIVHDFIPLRQGAHAAKDEQWHTYRYLVATLRNYDFLVANSECTAKEIGRVLPDYAGVVLTLHGRSRFLTASDRIAAASVASPVLQQLRDLRFVFVATADATRKNPELALQAAVAFQAMGLRLVVGGGLSQRTQRDLACRFPDQRFLADPIFLPRLTDEELAYVYQRAELVVVPSRDEGFSLPVAEAISLGVPVIASEIPAHAEQILHESLLFGPDSVADLLACARFALRAGNRTVIGDWYRGFDHAAEAAAFQSVVCPAIGRRKIQRKVGRTTIVGPLFDKPTGIATFNRLMVAGYNARGIPVDYVDPDELDAESFYAWLAANQFKEIIYVIGNNDHFHARAFAALLNVPGDCVLHDSRMFEFLLNCHGPHKIVELWARRDPATPIDVATVLEWQRDRRLLPYSFLDHIAARARTLVVHNKLLARHIASVYGMARAVFVPFAVQMTDDEIAFVAAERASRSGRVRSRVSLAMLGETEATKGCAEIILALKILLIQGYDAELVFVGKSDEPYHSELANLCSGLGIIERVTFQRYVPRATYLEGLVAADVVIQLRYPLFGQVSGPLADAVACAVPAVTTEELETGMGFDGCVRAVPNNFSPLHIAEAVRSLIDTKNTSDPRQPIATHMPRYLQMLMHAFSNDPLAA